MRPGSSGAPANRAGVEQCRGNEAAAERRRRILGVTFEAAATAQWVGRASGGRDRDRKGRRGAQPTPERDVRADPDLEAVMTAYRRRHPGGQMALVARELSPLAFAVQRRRSAGTISTST